MLKSTVTLIFIFAYLNYLKARCLISTQSDFVTNQPLLLRPGQLYGNNAFYTPINPNGEIILNSGDVSVLDCPGGILLLNGFPLSRPSANIICVSGKTFQLAGSPQTSAFYRFTCDRSISHLARYTTKTCLTSAYREIEIGFPLSDGRFLTQMKLCYDPVLQNTIYSQCNLTQAITGQQYNFPRPLDFVQDHFYAIGTHRLTSLYTRYVQRVNINALLGLPPTSLKYIDSTSDFYLSRGHLTAKMEFVFGPQQNSTFHYINVAPQWQTLNGNNWNEMEISTRRFASRKRYDLKVYTGTYGITTLPHDITKRDVQLFLYNDRVRRQGIPVPKFFWKVLYEPITSSGVAFISINNPYHYNLARDVFCTDVCHLITWPISWSRTNISLGYSYCCEVNDFRNAVGNILPAFPVIQLLN